MEKRAILAAVLMAALLIAYQTFFLGQGEPPRKAPTEPQAPAPTAQQPAAPSPPKAVETAPPKAEASTTARPLQRLARVEGPSFVAVVSSEGGKLQEFNLRYRGDKPMVIVGSLGPMGLMIDAGNGREAVPLELSSETVVLSPQRPTADLVLTGVDRGLHVRKTMRFDADRYTIDTFIRIENTGAAPRAVTVSLPWMTQETWRGETEKFPGQHPTEVLWQVDGHIERVENLAALGQHALSGQWIAMGSVWYLAALIPKTPGFKLEAAGEPKAKDDKEPSAKAMIAATATPTIGPGQAWEGHVVVYLGPKELDRLAALGLQGAINFGGFPVPRSWGGLPMEWLGIPILRVMHWVHDRIVANYGVAIIILTVISKIIFFPLTIMSMRSMRAMQALTPQINALRSKYKSDPQRVQRETMELYRQHKVNPLGGCLPMAAQVPIFYALYLALSVSVDLQNAPFLCFGRMPTWMPLLGGEELWICNLAGHDPTYILPILMGMSMFVQQRMTPTMGDPRQAKMMLVMPFVFTFMFLNVASGLVLYWFLSNVLQILQQMYMDRPRASKGAGREVKHAARA
jgi:YidC/Oxa1 family membrane protein insertase